MYAYYIWSWPKINKNELSKSRFAVYNFEIFVSVSKFDSLFNNKKKKKENLV